MINHYQNEKISRACYYAGLGIFVIGILLTGVMNLHSVDLRTVLPPCRFHTVTGYYCFGCGGTRSVYALLQGDIFKSLYYHIFVLYTVILYTAYMITYTLHICSKGWIRAIRFRPVYFYIAVMIIIVQCLIKNYLVYYYGWNLR